MGTPVYGGVWLDPKRYGAVLETYPRARGSLERRQTAEQEIADLPTCAGKFVVSIP